MPDEYKKITPEKKKTGNTLDDMLMRDKQEIESIKKEEHSKWPFEDIYKAMRSVYVPTISPFIKLDLVSKSEYKDLNTRVDEVRKGVDYLHYTTLKFRWDGADNAQGSIRTMFASYGLGAVALSP